ncbi:probable G-protein coupled receptor 82 isoform X2 [Salarias fasciatus]|nr:probable G-protein coupled receptor 82 isoform X2 [Salarias fasciatus]
MGNASLDSAPSLCPTPATLVFLPSMYTLLFLTALPGNALSLWVFTRRIPTVSPTHVYLSHLSVSNLLLSVTAPFLAAYYARGWAWTLRGAACQLVLHAVTPLQHINVYISLMILTCVALARFAAIIQNTHASRPSACTTLLPRAVFSRLSRVSFAKAVCAAVWALSVGGTVPVTVYYSVYEALRGAGGRGGCREMCYSPQVEIGGSLSAALTVPVIGAFFALYLLVLLCYMTVLRHIKRSRRSAHATSSQSLLSRVLRNIVVIQVVLSVCLLPYHIFKPIFIYLAHSQELPPALSDDSGTCSLCHPLSVSVEVKNCLFLLAALRGSTDPVMYFMLDKTFRHQTVPLLRCRRSVSDRRQTLWSITGRANQNAEENAQTTAVDSTF